MWRNREISEARIREVNMWLKEWCGKEVFLFMGHWHQFWGQWGPIPLGWSPPEPSWDQCSGEMSK